MRWERNLGAVEALGQLVLGEPSERVRFCEDAHYFFTRTRNAAPGVPPLGLIGSHLPEGRYDLWLDTPGFPKRFPTGFEWEKRWKLLITVRMWFRRVVLPLPRKPVRTVTGTLSSSAIL